MSQFALCRKRQPSHLQKKYTYTILIPVVSRKWWNLDITSPSCFLWSGEADDAFRLLLHLTYFPVRVAFSSTGSAPRGTLDVAGKFIRGFDFLVDVSSYAPPQFWPDIYWGHFVFPRYETSHINTCLVDVSSYAPPQFSPDIYWGHLVFPIYEIIKNTIRETREVINLV